jgi:hypothetical protein
MFATLSLDVVFRVMVGKRANCCDIGIVHGVKQGT